MDEEKHFRIRGDRRLEIDTQSPAGRWQRRREDRHGVAGMRLLACTLPGVRLTPELWRCRTRYATHQQQGHTLAERDQPGLTDHAPCTQPRRSSVGVSRCV